MKQNIKIAAAANKTRNPATIPPIAPGANPDEDLDAAEVEEDSAAPVLSGTNAVVWELVLIPAVNGEKPVVAANSF